jgi:hypothetical protein
MAGNHDGRRSIVPGFESFKQFKTAHAWHPGVDDETAFPARMIGFEEGLAA